MEDEVKPPLIVTKEEEDKQSDKPETVDFEKLVLEEDEKEETNKEDVKKYQIDDDFVDEEALKKEEESLTPEQLAVRV